jgi:hypothetical protein
MSFTVAITRVIEQGASNQRRKRKIRFNTSSETRWQTGLSIAIGAMRTTHGNQQQLRNSSIS